MAHTGGTVLRWKRCYQYAQDSNRLLATGGANEIDPADSCPPHYVDAPSLSQPYEYDDHGNMTRMPHLPLMQFDFLDQLQATSRTEMNNGGTPQTTFYVYDANGQRVRKVTERQAGPGQTPRRQHERVYLGGFEVYREYGDDGQTRTLERQTLHVMDGQQRVAQIDTRTIGDDGSPEQSRRFQFGNNLGSAVIEVDENADVVCCEEYHPYGTTAYRTERSVAETSLKRYRYTGKERDEETGLYYHGARNYACWLGRWMAADPVGLGDGVNMYMYVRDNPIKLYDPSGMFGEVVVHSDRQKALESRAAEISTLESQASAARIENRAALRDALGPEGFANQDYDRDRVRVLMDTSQNISFAEREIAKMKAELTRDQVQLAEDIKIAQMFRNTEGFVNRAALFVTVSLGSGAVIFGGAGLTGLGGAVAEGGVGGFGFGFGEELITQSESPGDETDYGKALNAGGRDALYGAATGGVLYGLGSLVGKIASKFRGGRPRTVAEALEPGLPQSKPSAEKAADAALRNKHEGKAAVELVKDGEVIATGVAGKRVPQNDEVTGVLMGTPLDRQSPFHGNCGEVHCLDKALNAGIDVEGAVFRAINIWGNRAKHPHGTPKPACASCQFLIEHFRLGGG
jgi:RHS repeat-associated protein